MTLKVRALGESRTGRSAGELVVEVVGDLRDCANEVGESDFVGVGKTGIDLALSRGVAMKPVGVGGGAVVRVAVAGVVLLDEAPVGSELEGMATFSPAQVVDQVVDRDAGDAVAGLGGG